MAASGSSAPASQPLKSVDGMTNRDDEDDIPAEIDFSRGVRGKYAARYRNGIVLMERAQDPIGLYEMQSRLGRALLSTQAFEGVLVAYLALVRDLSPQNAATETKSVLEFSVSSYLEELLNEWSVHTTSSPPIHERMDGFFRERNWLVHQSWRDVNPSTSVDEHRALAVRLEALTDEATFLGSSLDAMMSRTLEERGLTGSEISARTRKVLDHWAAA
jgi:hypothetical protein